jgi:hypothetical protein
VNKPVLIALAAASERLLALIGWAGIAILGHVWRQVPAITLIVLLVRHRARVAEGAP